MTCEQARKEMEEAKQAWLDAEKKLLNELSPYLGRVTVVFADEKEKRERLKGLEEEFVDAVNRGHNAIYAFFAARDLHRGG